MTRQDRANRQRAIRILEELKQAHPDVLDYRYELAATYAWIHVGFFPWQHPEAEPHAKSSLGMALAESRWLMEHNPSIPDYACSAALILAKLGQLRLRAKQYPQAESLFREAVKGQEDAIARFPELPVHHRVVCEFMRLKLAQAIFQGRLEDEASLRSRELLETCVTSLSALTQSPELAEDRLASEVMALVYSELNQVVSEMERQEE